MRKLPERDPELAYRIADEAILIAQRDPHTFADFKNVRFSSTLIRSTSVHSPDPRFTVAF
jgi:hypothetical protein